MALFCHDAKSPCYISAGIVAAFSSMLSSNASIIIDCDLAWRFRSVWAAHNKLHLAHPPKCRVEASIFGFGSDVNALLSLPVNLLGVIVVYPIFMQKITFIFCRWRSCSHVTRSCSTSLGFSSYGTQCPGFWIIPKAFKLFETVVCSTLNDAVSSVSPLHSRLGL